MNNPDDEAETTELVGPVALAIAQLAGKFADYPGFMWTHFLGGDCIAVLNPDTTPAYSRPQNRLMNSVFWFQKNIDMGVRVKSTLPLETKINPETVLSAPPSASWQQDNIVTKKRTAAGPFFPHHSPSLATML